MMLTKNRTKKKAELMRFLFGKSPFRVFLTGGLALLCSFVPQSSAFAEDDLSGTYVLFQQTTTLTRLPVLKDVTARTRSVALHELKHKGDRLFGAGKLCDLRIVSSSSMVKTSLPAAFRKLVSHLPFDARLKRDEGALTLEQESPTLVLGANLKNPLRDPLPTKAEDKRVIDQDGDGHPGVTVEISGIVSGQVYVVQRSKSMLVGEQKGSAFKGSVDFESEQKVIGASTGLLKRDPGGEPVPQNSYFVLQKVSSGMSCSDAVSASQRYPL